MKMIFSSHNLTFFVLSRVQYPSLKDMKPMEIEFMYTVEPVMGEVQLRCLHGSCTKIQT